MDFSAVCRTCLSKSCLNPIFVNEDHKPYSLSIFVSTGVKVELNDGMPQKMCTQCINFLNQYLKFRQKCKEVEAVLLKLKEQLQNEQNERIDRETDATINSNITKYKTVEIKMEVEVEKREVRNENTLCTISEDEDDKPLKYLLDDTTHDAVEILDAGSNETDVEATETKEKCIETREIEIYNEEWLKTVDGSCKRNNSAKKRRVTCKLCQKNLSVRSIDMHMARSHPGADERKVKCDLCDNYVLKEKMKRHKMMMHGSGWLKCGYCKSEYDSRELLIEHVATCTAKKKKRRANESGREMRECDVCHKTMQKASLRMHKAIKHAGLGPVCEHCGKRFGNKFRLNEHYRAKHGYEKFKCSYCEFQSAGVMAMRNHERRHRGEKPYVCESCGAKFHAAYLLAQHKQSHRTEKTIKCDLCPASFKANNSLHMHKSTCHSRSLFQCSMCSRAYSCRHYAVKHLRHVHRYSGPVPELQRLPPPETA
ncbi:uncharacterized protein ACR2FA_007315 [Aphomia sociella]